MSLKSFLEKNSINVFYIALAFLVLLLLNVNMNLFSIIGLQSSFGVFFGVGISAGILVILLGLLFMFVGLLWPGILVVLGGVILVFGTTLLNNIFSSLGTLATIIVIGGAVYLVYLARNKKIKTRK